MGRVFSRRWRANATKRFNDLGHSLWGPAQVKRWLTCAGQWLVWIEKLLHVLSLFEWRTRQDLVGAMGGGGDPLRHRGRGVRPCVWEEFPEQLSNMWQEIEQEAQRGSWTELALNRESWRQAVNKFVATM